MPLRFAAALALTLLVGCATSSSIFVAPELRPSRVVADTLARDSVREARKRVRVLLIGDAGAPRLDSPDPVLSLLRRHAISADSTPTVVVFLGDNVYPEGIPAAGHPGRELAEARLRAQLDAVKDLPVRTYFVPGNHDWAHSKPGGLTAVRRQEAIVEAALGERGGFIPSNGFPGPVAVELAEGIQMLAIDTEWWLTPFERAMGEDEEAGYTVREGNDFLLQLNDIVQEFDDDRVLVVGHHPLVSNGSHAGNVPPSRHFFPLLGKVDWGYIPLPILGSLSVLYTRTFGLSREDIGHPRYLSLRDGLEGIFRQHEGIIYAAGHDHSLQVHALDYGGVTVHQLISGSGPHASFTPGGGTALFTAERKGFLILNYYDDGSADIDALAVGKGE
ncbi:MAG TPA: metallophosphoesterase family protein, partial [Rhodothermales bacterium]|nr:metallophosphoesterase family protein [Rhodothermales bacterium]